MSDMYFIILINIGKDVAFLHSIMNQNDLPFNAICCALKPPPTKRYTLEPNGQA